MENILKIELDLPKPEKTRRYFMLRKKETEKAMENINWQNRSYHYEGNTLIVEQD